jgi:hypothetical protein
VTAEEVNALLKEASETYLKDILGFDEVPKVRGCSPRAWAPALAQRAWGGLLLRGEPARARAHLRT